MRRSLIQFDEESYEKLRRRAFEEGKSISAVVRELVDLGLEPAKSRAKRIRQPSFVAAGKSKQGKLSPVSENHDQALGDLKR